MTENVTYRNSYSSGLVQTKSSLSFSVGFFFFFLHVRQSYLIQPIMNTKFEAVTTNLQKNETSAKRPNRSFFYL